MGDSLRVVSTSTSLVVRNELIAPALLALLLLFGLPLPSAHAGILDVREILINVIDQRTAGVTDEWSFGIEIDAGDVSSISVLTPPSVLFPGGETLDETDFEQDGDYWCLEAAFVSLAALQARFTTGDYAFTINGSQVSLGFNPPVPDGLISVSFPANGAMLPNGQPTFTSTSTCTNCNLVEALVEDGFGQIEIETNAISPMPLPSSFPFAGFGPNLGAGGPISSLPLATGLDFCVLESAIVISEETIGAGDSFDYVQERGADDRVSFTVTTPALGSDVDEVILEYAEFDDEWFFGATVEGTGITTAMVIPPNQAPVALPLVDPEEFEFREGPFVDEAAVRAAFPPTSGAGRYVVVIDGGERFYSAQYALGSPNGGIVLQSPMDGATVSSMPSFTISNACTNCESQFLAVESFANTDVDIDVLSDLMPFPTTIDFADFGPNQGDLGPISELPMGTYDVELDTAIEDFISATFVPADDFDYKPGVFREDNITITVPEPGASIAGLLACLTMAGLRRARRPS